MRSDFATGHADSARALMADADDDKDANDANDANDSDFAHTPAKILGASFMATPAFDLDGAFGAVDSTVDFDYISPPSPTPLPTSFSLPIPLFLLFPLHLFRSLALSSPLSLSLLRKASCISRTHSTTMISAHPTLSHHNDLCSTHSLPSIWGGSS